MEERRRGRPKKVKIATPKRKPGRPKRGPLRTDPDRWAIAYAWAVMAGGVSERAAFDHAAALFSPAVADPLRLIEEDKVALSVRLKHATVSGRAASLRQKSKAVRDPRDSQWLLQVAQGLTLIHKGKRVLGLMLIEMAEAEGRIST